MEDSANRSYQVAAVEKALRVLNVFALPPHRYSLTEIGQRSELSPNQSFRLLQTLLLNGYVRQDGETKLYRLGSRVFGLASALFHGDPLVLAGADALSEAQELTGETVAIIAADGDETVCVDARESAHPLHVSASIGSRMESLHAGAVGKLFLAARSDAEIERYLAEHQPLTRFTSRTLVNIDDLRADIELIRQRGYAISEEEVAEGMTGIAAPIHDRTGRVVAGITLSAPATRVSDADLARYQEVLVTRGRKISGNLGYRPSGLLQT